MKTGRFKLLVASAAVLAGAGAAQAKERPAEVGTIAAGQANTVNRGLSQRYCIVDPSMATPKTRRVCHSLAEWQVAGIDPRRMPRL